MANVAFDAWVAKYYLHKVQSCADRGVEWNLPLTSLKNILRAKYCYYTGLELTKPPIDNHGQMPKNYKFKNTDVTVDRIDSNKGYEVGNCVASSKYANGLKSVFEDPNNGYTTEHFIHMAKKLEKINKGLYNGH